jgi:glutamate-1-semialdehyde 2,1-aminomutase
LSAAAGAACLEKCADPAVQRHCDAMAARLRTGFNTVLDRHGIPGFAWGESSVFHTILGEEVPNRTAADLRAPARLSPSTLKTDGRAALANVLGAATLLEGVDLFNAGGLLSVAHTPADIDFTIAAFERAVLRIRDEGLLG